MIPLESRVTVGVVKSLYEEAGGLGIPTWVAFRERVATAVKDFGALVIDSHDQRTPLRTTCAPKGTIQADRV